MTNNSDDSKINSGSTIPSGHYSTDYQIRNVHVTVSTATSSTSYLENKIQVTGSHSGKISIPIDIEYNKQFRENILANRGPEPKKESDCGSD